MTLLIRDYCAQPRLAIVRLGNAPNEKNETETIYITNSNLTFSSDGLSFTLDERDQRLIENLYDGDIVTVDDKGIVYKMYDSRDDDATIFLTGLCNSNCIMCPETDTERRYDDGIPTSWMRDYIDLLPDDITHVVITGGEPTLNTELFFDVMTHLKIRFNSVDMLLLTNGRSFASKMMVERLNSCYPEYLTIAIPIHGHTARLHDSISRAQGSFQQTCMGIEHLQENGARIELRIVVSRINYQYLSDIAEFIVLRYPSAHIVNFVGLEVMGNCAKYFEQVYIDYVDAFPYIRPAVELLIKAGIDVSLYNFPFCTVEPGFWSLCRKSISPYKIRFSGVCDECEAKSQCGGVFRSTLSAAKPKLTPIHF